jgi:tetratricopeptide (TPR) repeat protein
MTDPSTWQPNSFAQVMLGLAYDDAVAPDLFSQACIEEYQQSDPAEFGYLFAQVFEPTVLEEIALLARLDHEDVANLRHQPTDTMRSLANRLGEIRELPTVPLVNVAAALLSISRFNLARGALTEAGARSLTAREQFEIGMLEFVISNRCEDGGSTPAAFARMQAAIEAGDLPPDRVIDACAQAVVWYSKRREISRSSFEYFLSLGRRLAGVPGLVGSAALSSWYRGVAMVPAESKESAQTRRYMELAREEAERTITERPRPYERHLIKTYYESSLKEHMYLSRDEERAEQAARDLIAVDPVWPPSHGELAEALSFFGRPAEAAQAWVTAAELGPPYVGHHRLMAARTLEKLGRPAKALQQYLAMIDIAPPARELLAAARDLAMVTAHPAQAWLVELAAAPGLHGD